MNNNDKKKLIQEKFLNEANMLKFYADLCQLQEDEHGNPIDYDFSNFSSEDITTAIIVSAHYTENDTFNLEVITEGYHRSLTTNDEITDTILTSRSQMLACCEDEEKDRIEKFEYLNKKPFLINITNNIVDYLLPLDIALYNKCYPMFLELMEN